MAASCIISASFVIPGSSIVGVIFQSFVITIDGFLIPLELVECKALAVMSIGICRVKFEDPVIRADCFLEVPEFFQGFSLPVHYLPVTRGGIKDLPITLNGFLIPAKPFESRSFLGQGSGISRFELQDFIVIIQCFFRSFQLHEY